MMSLCFVSTFEMHKGCWHLPVDDGNVSLLRTSVDTRENIDTTHLCFTGLRVRQLSIPTLVWVLFCLWNKQVTQSTAKDTYVADSCYSGLALWRDSKWKTDSTVILALKLSLETFGPVPCAYSDRMGRGCSIPSFIRFGGCRLLASLCCTLNLACRVWEEE
jgi:hypothetical protein